MGFCDGTFGYIAIQVAPLLQWRCLFVSRLNSGRVSQFHCVVVAENNAGIDASRLDRGNSYNDNLTLQCELLGSSPPLCQMEEINRMQQLLCRRIGSTYGFGLDE